jgi:hypothetical protein
MKAKLLVAIPLAVLVALITLYGTAYIRTKRLIDTQLEQLVAGGLYEKAEYAQLWLSPLGNVAITALRLQQPDMEIVINAVRVSDVDLLHDVPWHLRVAVDGIHFPQGLPDRGGTGNPLLETLLTDLVHDDTLNLHLEYGYRYDPEQSEQIVSSAAVALPGYFALEGDTEIRNVPLGTLASLKAAEPATTATLQAELLEKAALPHVGLRLSDSGLIQVLIGVMAESNAMQPNAMREQLKSQLQNYYLVLPGNLQNFGQQLGQQLATFIDGHRTLTVTASPAFDGEIARLQPELMATILTGSFDKGIELLNLEINVE